MLLGYSGWLPGCYMVGQVFWLVSRVLLCSCSDVMSSCQGVVCVLWVDTSVLGSCPGVTMRCWGNIWSPWVF